MQRETIHCKMAPTRVILMSCGSYNPPTNMHLRMFEIARDHLHRMGTHIVVGALISPTHDDYAKKELASAEHRCAMLKLATQNSDWIRVSTWETRQNGWTKTRISLQHHQNLLNSVLLNTNDTNHRSDIDDTDWIPENVKNSTDRTPIQIKLLCGADLLESFGTPGLWADEDIDAIVGQHGLVVITREGSNPNKFIYDSDILSKYMHNIYIVTEWIPNEVSSTKIRRALKRGESVRYLVQDSVIEYVYKHGIYDAKTVSTIKLELSTKNSNDYLNVQPKYQSVFLTPSPSDVTMTTPSPVEIISIDISESVLKRNLQNSPGSPGRRNCSKITLNDDTERMREKFISVISENGNKLVATNKVVYPGQAKQIIANESGESQIFCEVGLSCISENYRVEMEIDGKADRDDDNKVSLESMCKNVSSEIVESDRVAIINDETNSQTVKVFRSSEQTLLPDDSESKESIVVLSFSVIDTPNIDCRHISSSNEELPTSRVNEQRPTDKSINGLEKDEEAPNKKESSSIDLKSANSINDEQNQCLLVDGEKSVEEKNRVEIVEIIEKEAVGPKIIASLLNDSHQDLSEQKDHSENSLNENLAGTDENPIIPINEADSSESDSINDELPPKRDENIEIDGKYIKSIVNSRKSPKKVINEDHDEITAESTLNLSKLTKTKDKDKSNDKVELEKSSSLPVTLTKTEVSEKSVKTTGPRRGVLFQGSLDSINVKQPKSSSAIDPHSHKPISKKSKSYEFIKPTETQPTTIYKISLIDHKDNPGSSCENTSRIKSDSNSIFETANDPQEEAQTDEFCSVCCYANDPSSNEAFYTLRSNESSPLEKASTECDICSNCDLREDPEETTTNFKAAPGEPLCELCEICGDVAMDEDVVASSRPEKDDFVDRRLLASRPLPLSLPKRKKGVVRLNARTFNNIDDDDDDEDDIDHFEIDTSGIRRKISETHDKLKILRGKSNEEHSTDDTNSNDDEFEIENCGLDLDLDFDNGNDNTSRYKTEVEDTLRNIVPRDEIAMSGKSSKKIIRAGSLINRDTFDRTRVKRRYSSVDNLQNSRQTVKTPMEKPNTLRSRGIVKGLVASADNIRPVRTSRSRSLRKSADDVGRDYHSSMDDAKESPLYENIERKKVNSKDQHKPRDSGTIKMILTKHGIKIISDKETAL